MKTINKYISLAIIALTILTSNGATSSGFSSSKSSSSSSSRSSGFSSSKPSSSSSSRSSGFSSPSKSTTSSGPSSSSKSSGFSSPSKPSPSYSSPSKPSSSSSISSSSKSSGFSFGNSSAPKTVTSVSKISDVDAAASQKLAISGGSKTTKQQAQESYKQKYSSTFEKEPVTRPNYIPNETRVGNTTYHVVYDNRYHGYGYYDSFGRWMLYDAMADAAMASVIMSQPQRTVYVNPGGQTVVTTSHLGYGMGIFVFFIVLGILVVIGIAIHK